MAKEVKRVQVDVTVRLTVELTGRVTAEKVINEMDYNFKDLTKKAEIVNTEITNFDVL